MSESKLPERLERAREIACETIAGDSRVKRSATAVREGQQWIDWIFGAEAAKPTGTFSQAFMSAVRFAVTDGINGAYGIAGGNAPELSEVRLRRSSTS